MHKTQSPDDIMKKERKLTTEKKIKKFITGTKP